MAKQRRQLENVYSLGIALAAALLAPAACETQSGGASTAGTTLTVKNLNTTGTVTVTVTASDTSSHTFADVGADTNSAEASIERWNLTENVQVECDAAEECLSGTVTLKKDGTNSISVSAAAAPIANFTANDDPDTGGDNGGGSGW